MVARSARYGDESKDPLRCADSGFIPAMINRMVDRGIGWIHSNFQRFLPSKDNPQPNNQQLQSLSELAVFCWLVLERSKSFGHDDRLWSCATQVKEVYCSPIFFERLYRLPDPFISQALIAVSLHRIGLLPSTELRPLQENLDRTNALVSERLPHRQLELRHILDAGGFVYSLPSYRTLYRGSVAAKSLNPIYATGFDAYSVTHALFYSSDFGACEVRGASPSHISRTSYTVEMLLGMYIREGNWDLVAELLLSSYCLRKTSSLIYGEGWKRLIAAQQQSGALPGPDYSGAKERELSNVAREAYVFETSYHTTLVSALAGALCPCPNQLE